MGENGIGRELRTAWAFAGCEELLAYQLSVDFKRAAYELVKTHPGAARDLRYRDQLSSAASAVTANIAEGFGRRTAEGISAVPLRTLGVQLAKP